MLVDRSSASRLIRPCFLLDQDNWSCGAHPGWSTLTMTCSGPGDWFFRGQWRPQGPGRSKGSGDSEQAGARPCTAVRPWKANTRTEVIECLAPVPALWILPKDAVFQWPAPPAGDSARQRSSTALPFVADWENRRGAGPVSGTANSDEKWGLDSGRLDLRQNRAKADG